MAVLPIGLASAMCPARLAGPQLPPAAVGQKLWQGDGLMIAHMLAAGLLWATLQPNFNQARQGYSACVGASLRTQLRERVAPDVFEAALATSCKAEEATFRAASVAQDVAAGLGRANAEQNVQFGTTEIIENTTQRFRDYIETNTEPR